MTASRLPGSRDGVMRDDGNGLIIHMDDKADLIVVKILRDGIRLGGLIQRSGLCRTQRHVR